MKDIINLIAAKNTVLLNSKKISSNEQKNREIIIKSAFLLSETQKENQNLDDILIQVTEVFTLMIEKAILSKVNNQELEEITNQYLLKITNIQENFYCEREFVSKIEHLIGYMLSLNTLESSEYYQYSNITDLSYFNILMEICKSMGACKDILISVTKGLLLLKELNDNKLATANHENKIKTLEVVSKNIHTKTEHLKRNIHFVFQQNSLSA